MSTFISYSRVNSDFAVRLAQDLKSAGFDVWLDQLDIPTGARWDDAIEKALETSVIFLIVLSPQSIQSQNVKDEIGYAIDAGKQILPVVIEDCKVPFRLRRFQYVDFTGRPYEESLVKIKYLLSNTKVLDEIKQADADEPDDEGKQTNNIPAQRSPVPEPKPTHAIEASVVPPARKWNPWVFLAAAGVVLIALIFLFRGNFMAPEASPTAETTDTVPIAISTPIPFTETATSVPASETPVLPTSTITPFPEEWTDPSGTVMRLIPAGEFIMGSDTGETDERPVHTVFLDAYYIDKYEVTNALYGACVSANVCDPPKQTNSFRNVGYYGTSQFDNYPVIFVDWGMAKTYCEWRGAQLPTEAQWEKAARGTDGRTYPWGDGLDCARANYGGCAQDTKFIGSAERGRSIYGVYDMAGNVWEWVADWYSADYYRDSHASNPKGPDAGASHVLRGGSWADLGSSSRSSNRYNVDASMYGNSVGFRCAIPAP